jgi:hypothetical protein
MGAEPPSPEPGLPAEKQGPTVPSVPSAIRDSLGEPSSSSSRRLWILLALGGIGLLLVIILLARLL